uniref:Major capsid protein n=1 Tax=Pithovirus LCPAC403 TaxID=2506596 RepID=A0A481ZCH9_9VIRU|nr:MAG: major capsid protein [Pithovirus LCPAC403]
MAQHKTAKIDLDQIKSVVQSELHNADKSDKDDSVYNRFQFDTKKYSLDVKVLSKMKTSSSTEEHGAIFNLDSKMDYVLYLYEKINLPTVEVEEKFKGVIEIAWTHNVIHHISKGVYLYIDDEDALTIDSNWFDVYCQYFVSHISRDYCSNAGITPDLENFGTVLHGKPIAVKIPFEFSSSLAHSLPVYKIVNNIQFKFEFQPRICKLLRMRELIDDVWINIEVDPKYLARMNALSEIPKPEIRCRYALQNETIRDYYYDQADTRILHLLDVVTIKSINDVDFGKSIEIELECPNPCRGIFCTAQNITARDLNYYANYTTNANDHTIGENPIEYLSISYGSVDREVKLDNLDFAMLTSEEMPNDPIDKGYICLNNSFEIFSTEQDTSIIYLQNNAKLKLKIRDKKPGEPDTKFSIQVKLLTVKKFVHDNRKNLFYVQDFYSK